MQKESDDAVRACEQILACRADVCAKDSLGLSPHDLAAAHSNVRISALLSAAGAPARNGSRLSAAEVARLCKEREDHWREADLTERRDIRRQSLAHMERDYQK